MSNLIWEDTRLVEFDTTMLFGHGYEFFGLDNLREETNTEKGRFAIWPENISKACWALYGGHDGLYMSGFKTKEDAQTALLKELGIIEGGSIKITIQPVMALSNEKEL